MLNMQVSTQPLFFTEFRRTLRPDVPTSHRPALCFGPLKAKDWRSTANVHITCTGHMVLFGTASSARSGLADRFAACPFRLTSWSSTRQRVHQVFYQRRQGRRYSPRIGVVATTCKQVLSARTQRKMRGRALPTWEYPSRSSLSRPPSLLELSVSRKATAAYPRPIPQSTLSSE